MVLMIPFSMEALDDNQGMGWGIIAVIIVNIVVNYAVIVIYSVWTLVTKIKRIFKMR